MGLTNAELDKITKISPACIHPTPKFNRLPFTPPPPEIFTPPAPAPAPAPSLTTGSSLIAVGAPPARPPSLRTGHRGGVRSWPDGRAGLGAGAGAGPPLGGCPGRWWAAGTALTRPALSAGDQELERSGPPPAPLEETRGLGGDAKTGGWGSAKASLLTLRLKINTTDYNMIINCRHA